MTSRRRMIPILMYHQVAEIPRNMDPLGLAVPPGQFEEQMRYLERNGYSCLTLPEAVRYFQKDARTPSKTFVITFDDGYQDIFTTVCPILEKFGFAATVFLVAGRVGTQATGWVRKGRSRGNFYPGLMQGPLRKEELSLAAIPSATIASAYWMINLLLRNCGVQRCLSRTGWHCRLIFSPIHTQIRTRALSTWFRQPGTPLHALEIQALEHISPLAHPLPER